MDEGSLIASLDRIEAALARVEACAQLTAGASAKAPDDDLERRHVALRGSVQAALARLDALLDERET
ncbi:hypothetical protein [uncultured Novosphingobium sp.]|uniref:hypothetical protein n=1 Tax=Novosphingobium fluoreni TaxID=1391222 RepID=UPI003747D3BF